MRCNVVDQAYLAEDIFWWGLAVMKLRVPEKADEFID
jgi:hypothetical protein